MRLVWVVASTEQVQKTHFLIYDETSGENSNVGKAIPLVGRKQEVDKMFLKHKKARFHCSE